MKYNAYATHCMEYAYNYVYLFYCGDNMTWMEAT